MFNFIKEVTTNIKNICANDHASCLNWPCLPEKQTGVLVFFRGRPSERYRKLAEPWRLRSKHPGFAMERRERIFYCSLLTISIRLIRGALWRVTRRMDLIIYIYKTAAAWNSVRWKRTMYMDDLFNTRNSASSSSICDINCEFPRLVLKNIKLITIVITSSSSSSLARQPLVGPGLLKKLCLFVSVESDLLPILDL